MIETYYDHAKKQAGKIKIICAHRFGTTIQKIESADRYRETSDARHLALFFMHKYFWPKLNMRQIGEIIANRDHSTVIHAIKKVNDILMSDARMRDIFLDIDNAFTNLIQVEQPEEIVTETKYPAKCTIQTTIDIYGETIARIYYWDGTERSFSILDNGITTKKLFGDEALVEFTQLINQLIF